MFKLLDLDKDGVMPKKKPEDCNCDTGIIACSCEGFNACLSEIEGLGVEVDWDKRTVKLVRVK